MAEKVLVTVGFGLVGSQTVRRLAADGHRVVATDLGTAAQRKAAKSLPAGVEARWADLTDPGEVDRLVAETSPTVIIHLAAVIPPVIYRQPELAPRVNDWMDTARSQQALSFQHHRWPDMLAEMRALAGWRRYPMRLLAPIVRRVLKRRAAYRNAPGRYADPWGAIRTEMGEPRPDIKECVPAS